MKPIFKQVLDCKGFDSQYEVFFGSLKIGLVSKVHVDWRSNRSIWQFDRSGSRGQVTNRNHAAQSLIQIAKQLKEI